MILLFSDSDMATQMSVALMDISFVDFLHFCFTPLRVHTDRVYLTGVFDACYRPITVYFRACSSPVITTDQTFLKIINIKCQLFPLIFPLRLNKSPLLVRVCDPSRCSLTKAQSRSWPSASWLMWRPPLFSAPCVSCSQGRLAPSTCTATPGLPSQEVSLLPHLPVFPDQGEAAAHRRWTQTCICGSRRVRVSASWKTTTSRWSWEGDRATEQWENVKIVPHITPPQLKYLGPD